MKKEDLQQRFVELQIVDQQVKSLQQQLVMLEQQAVETTKLIDDIEQLKKVKPKTRMYAQIGPGVAVESAIEKTDHVLMGVGANTLVKKSLPDAQHMLHTQLEEIQKVTQHIHTELQKLLTHANALKTEIRKVSQQKQE